MMLIYKCCILLANTQFVLQKVETEYDDEGENESNRFNYWFCL